MVGRHNNPCVSFSSMESRRNLLSLFIFLFFGTCAHSEDPLSCLLSAGVRNITTSYSPTYLNLLQVSIQNLRFAQPFVNKPIALILPENNGQVSAAINCSRKERWTIRLRSGGHSYEALSSRADTPFVIIDLMKLNQVSIDLRSETAWIGGGATLGEIYHAISSASNQHGFPAGLCATVGNGGHFGGGGWGAMTRKDGLAADNIVDAILVDADGRLLDRESMGEDVFWAIRSGGGGNWGAVVAWKIRLVEVPETVTSFFVTRNGSVSQAANLWHKWQFVAPNLPNDFFLQVLVLPQNEQTGISLTFMALYLGPRSSAYKLINQSFPELDITLQDCKEMSWIEGLIYVRGDPDVRNVADLTNRATYHKTFTKAKSDFVTAPINISGIEGALQMVAEQPKSNLLLDPLGGVSNDISSDAIPFPHRAGNLYMIEYFVNWEEEDAERGREYLNWLRSLYDYMEPYVSKNPRRAYVNNVDLDLGVFDWRKHFKSGFDAVKIASSWGSKYFGGNYERLVRAKTYVDPHNVFRHPQSIPPSTLVQY